MCSDNEDKDYFARAKLSTGSLLTCRYCLFLCLYYDVITASYQHSSVGQVERKLAIYFKAESKCYAAPSDK